MAEKLTNGLANRRLQPLGHLTVSTFTVGNAAPTLKG